MSIVKLDHIGVAVRDIEKSKILYCDLLGFTEVIVDFNPPLPMYNRIVFLKKGDIRIQLSEIKESFGWVPMPEGRYVGTVHISLEADNIITEHQKFLDAGLKERFEPAFTGDPPIKGEDHYWISYVFGFDGELIELRGPHPDHPPK